MNVSTIRRAVLASGLLAPIAAISAARAQTAPGACAPATPSEAEQRLHTDWAWLGRYRAENAVDAALPQDRRQVVFMGDSITQAWREKEGPFFTQHGFVGRGISGQTTPQMLVRFMADVVALKPAAVHIMAATNDVAQNTGPYDPAFTKQNFVAMAEIARAHRLRVILASVPPAGEFPWRPGLGPAAKIVALNGWLRAWAAEQGFTYADYSAVLDDGSGAMKPGMAYDGVHPTEAGYQAMAPVTLAAVEAALASAR
jgi:lysophospholipase L1-like esterase